MFFLHMKERAINPSPLTGDQMLAVLGALANPHRLRIVAALSAEGRNYVSRLAREVGISRPLLHLHLQKLADAGLVTHKLELSSDGKALNYFEVVDFSFELSPTTIAEAARSLTPSLKSP
jgi:DNA-binding transcriptional ArsR family regulator